MTTWVVLGIGVLVVAGAFGWVAWRDRLRNGSGEDRAAGRAARTTQQRYEGARQAVQSEVVRRNNNHN